MSLSFPNHACFLLIPLYIYIYRNDRARMGRRLGELHGKSKEASSVSVVGAVDDPEMVVAEVHRFSLFLNLLLEFSRVLQRRS